MQRVKDHRYLYRRRHSWVFRRAVPAEARAAFGTSEVHVTLNASSIAEARLAMQPHLESFERKLRLAKHGGLIDDPNAQPPDPSLMEIEAVVRQWLAERIDRCRSALGKLVENVADMAGLDIIDHQLAGLNVITQRRAAAHPHPLSAAGGELVADTLGGHFAFELGE